MKKSNAETNEKSRISKGEYSKSMISNLVKVKQETVSDFLKMKQESQKFLFTRNSMAVFWYSRMVSVVFVFLPITTNYSVFSIYLYLLAALNLCASWYSSHLVMELIAKHKFAGNLQDIAFSLGFGRASIVLISMVSGLSLAFMPAY